MGCDPMPSFKGAFGIRGRAGLFSFEIAMGKMSGDPDSHRVFPHRSEGSELIRQYCGPQWPYDNTNTSPPGLLFYDQAPEPWAQS
jgi:hypothetical protein